MALYSFQAKAITFEEYIVDHSSDEMRAYLTGYADAVHNNAYFIGGCPRKLPYRPYGEYFQHIDIYISKKTKDKSTDLNAFYQEPVEPLLTAVILKYINCNNPEARYLKNEPKRIQIEMRDLARNIMNETVKFQTPEEREKEFAYKQHIDRLNNPKKYETKCPTCPKPQKCVQSNKSVTPKPTPVSVPSPVVAPVAMPEQKMDIQKIEAQKVEVQNVDGHNHQPQQHNEHWYNRIHIPVKKEHAREQKEELKIEKKPETVNETPKVEKQDDVKILNDIPPLNQLEKTIEPEPLKKFIPNDEPKPIDATPQKNEKPIKEEPNPDPLLDPNTMPEIEIPAEIIKKDVKEVDVVDIKAKTYELDSLNINLDNIENVTLPSL